jgi:hypothetical protein
MAMRHFRGRLFATAAAVSLGIAVALAFLWVTDPGGFFNQYTPGHQYSASVANGRLRCFITDLVWPPPTSPFGKSVLSSRMVLDVPLWPLIAAALILPAAWLVSFRAAKAKEQRGFDVQPRTNPPAPPPPQQ